MARRAGVTYAVQDGLTLAVTAALSPPTALPAAAGPTRFDVPDAVLEGLRELAARHDKTLTALVIETLEDELAAELAAVDEYLRREGAPLPRAS